MVFLLITLFNFNYLVVFCLILPSFRRYMEEKVQLAKVDVDAGVKAKFSGLVADAGVSALCVF